MESAKSVAKRKFLGKGARMSETTSDCIFCNIVQGKTDTSFLFENEHLVVFRDIYPHAPVHLLIVPRRHIRSINDVEEGDREILSEAVWVGREMARREKVDRSGYKLLYNVERGGGQVIFHLHMHLLGGWKRER
jgi:histidine triad (HIT) family protein